jgi:hypothetical protein
MPPVITGMIVASQAMARAVLRARRGGQGLQHRADHRGALRVRSPVITAAPLGGLHPELAVFEVWLRVVVVVGQRPGVNLGGQASQVLFAGPGPGGGDQDAGGRGPCP